MAHLGRVIVGLILAAAAVTIAAAPVPAAKIKHYVDPQQRFALAIPSDAVIDKPRPEVALSLQSREGYAMRLQIGAAAPDRALADMSRRMEARYLGAAKVWRAKLGERMISVAGMQAYDALYEGTRTRTRVVIARGQRSDFVFMFFAPTEQFESFTPRFEFMLDNFRPAPGETAAKSPPPTETARQPAAKVAAPASTPASKPPVTSASAQRFSDPAAGYSIAYPKDWMIDRPSAHTIIFSGQEGTHAYYATVSIQNTAPPQAKQNGQAVSAVLADLRAQFSGRGANVAFNAERPYIYKFGTARLRGLEFSLSYMRGGQRFKQLTVILPRPRSTVVHVWAYAAPEDRFSVYEPVALAMLKSWTIVASAQ